MQIAFPLQIFNGRLVEASSDDHIRQMIEELLFTRPGERVNRPDFGCGIDLVVFEPGSTEVVAATQALVRAALQKWLGDIIAVEQVTVAADASTITVTVQYVSLLSRERRVEVFTR